MPLEFRDGFCTPSEPSARVWHKGNYPRCPITVDVDLQHNQVSINECAVVSVKVVSTPKEARSAHVEILKMDVQDEGRKERIAPKPESCHEAKACLCLFLQKRKHVPGIFQLSTSPVFWK